MLYARLKPLPEGHVILSIKRKGVFTNKQLGFVKIKVDELLTWDEGKQL